MTEILNRFVTEREAYAARVRAIRRGGELQIEDPSLDLKWAQFQQDTTGPKSYFDYFFSGEDMRVYLGETGDDPEFGDLPMAGLGFAVSQQKMPIYGHASYTYDAVLRGTRLINGQFTLYSRYPGYMKKLLAKAASNRVHNGRSLADDYPSPEGWRNDDENLERYWGKTVDRSALAQEGTEWSIHPPFSLVVVYGVDSVSVDADYSQSSYNRYRDDNLMFYDINQRLVEDEDEDNASRFILDGCELMGVERNFLPGTICVESYSFFARDIFVPSPRNRGGRARSGGASPLAGGPVVF